MNFLNTSRGTGTGKGVAPSRRYRVVGYRIRLSDGLCIKAHYVDRTIKPSNDDAIFSSKSDASFFIKTRKAAMKAERRPSIFDVHKYRFEAVYG